MTSLLFELLQFLTLKGQMNSAYPNQVLPRPSVVACTLGPREGEDVVGKVEVQSTLSCPQSPLHSSDLQQGPWMVAAAPIAPPGNRMCAPGAADFSLCSSSSP